MAQQKLALPSRTDYRVNFYATPGTFAIGPGPVRPFKLPHGTILSGGGVEYSSPGPVYVDKPTKTFTPLGP
jgi:hypothetical protein